MPNPILKPATLPPISADAATNGEQQPFGAQMEEMLTKAFEEARPDPLKARPAQASVALSVPVPAKSRDTLDAGTEPPAKSEPELKPPAKATQWKEVNEERARLKAENETLKTEREKWKSWETEKGQYDTIKRHNDELLNRIQQIAVEKDPRFESYFKAKTETAIALAKQAVGESHAERVSKLLQLPDSDWRTEQLETVMSELSSTRQSRLGAAIVEMDRINLERSTALSKSKENWEAMQQADRADKQNKAQQFERTFQDTLQKWSDPEKGLALFQEKDGDESHNAEVRQRVETARNILNLKLSADQLVKASLWSSAAPGLLKNQIALSEENKALKAELEALKAGGPELKTGQEEGLPTDDEKQYDGMSFGQIIAEKARKAGGWS